jgi:hypothetical protein
VVTDRDRAVVAWVAVIGAMGDGRKRQGNVERNGSPPKPRTRRKQLITREAETSEEDLADREAQPTLVGRSVSRSHRAERTPTPASARDERQQRHARFRRFVSLLGHAE